MAKNEKATYEIDLEDRLSGKLGKATNNARKLDNAMGKVSQGAQKSESVFAGMLKFNAFSILAEGALSLGKAIVSSGAAMEQTRVSFKVLLKDAEKANEVIGQLQEFSNVTPFDQNSVLQAGKSLTAFGVQTEALLPSLQAIGDIAAGTGKDFNELVTIYGKAKVAGTLYAEDINQLVEAGIPVMGEFAKALGTTEANVKKMASEGKLKFKDLQTAFANLTEGSGMYAGLMEEQSKTVAGKWSTLVGKVQGALSKLGESGNGVLGKLLDGALEVFNFFTTQWAGIAAAFEPLTSAISEVWQEFSGLFSTMGEGLTITDVLKKTFNAIGYAMRFLSPLFKAFARGFIVTLDVIKKVGKALWGLVQRVFGTGDTFKKLASGVVAEFVFIKEAATNILSGVGDLLAGIFSGDLDQINKGLDGLKTSFSKAGSSAAEAFDESFRTEQKDLFEGKKDKLPAAVEQQKKLSDFIGSGNASPGGSGSGAGSKQASSSVGGVSSGRPTTVNVDIGKLIETFIVNTSDLSDLEDQVRALVSKTLVTAVNDVNLIAK